MASSVILFLLANNASDQPTQCRPRFIQIFVDDALADLRFLEDAIRPVV
jgi:hypothetical protein